MVLKANHFDKQKPKNKQVIIIREKGAYYPLIGEYRVSNGKEEIYLPSYYETIELNQVEPWWFGMTEEFLRKSY